MKRTERFGKIFAIAHILGENNKEPGTPSISEKYMIRYQQDPGGTLPDIRRELMKDMGKYNTRDQILFGMFLDLIMGMSIDDMKEGQLERDFIAEYYKEKRRLVR